jgi:hypothetical protein
LGAARGGSERSGRPRAALRAAFAALLAAACGGHAPAAPRATTAKSAAPSDAPGAGTDRDPVATLDAIASRGSVDAPLMREVARWEKAAPRSPEVRADRDACIRVAYATSATVRAWLEDGSGVRRGDVASGADGMVPPQGPACVRRGDALRLVVDGAPDGAVVRAVVFGAP